MGFKLTEPDSLVCRGVDKPLQFVRVVYIGHEALRHLWNCCRQRRLVDEATTGGVAIEAAQHVVLATPVGIQTSPSQELFHMFSSDVGEIDISSHPIAKRVQQAGGTVKISSHRLSKRHVL